MLFITNYNIKLNKIQKKVEHIPYNTQIPPKRQTLGCILIKIYRKEESNLVLTNCTMALTNAFWKALSSCVKTPASDLRSTPNTAGYSTV